MHFYSVSHLSTEIFVWTFPWYPTHPRWQLSRLIVDVQIKYPNGDQYGSGLAPLRRNQEPCSRRHDAKGKRPALGLQPENRQLSHKGLIQPRWPIFWHSKFDIKFNFGPCWCNGAAILGWCCVWTTIIRPCYMSLMSRIKEKRSPASLLRFGSTPRVTLCRTQRPTTWPILKPQW